MWTACWYCAVCPDNSTQGVLRGSWIFRRCSAMFLCPKSEFRRFSALGISELKKTSQKCPKIGNPALRGYSAVLGLQTQLSKTYPDSTLCDSSLPCVYCYLYCAGVRSLDSAKLCSGLPRSACQYPPIFLHPGGCKSYLFHACKRPCCTKFQTYTRPSHGCAAVGVP